MPGGAIEDNARDIARGIRVSSLPEGAVEANAQVIDRPEGQLIQPGEYEQDQSNSSLHSGTNVNTNASSIAAAPL